MAYFDLFPDVLLPSFSNDRNSSNDLQLSKNLYKRGKIRDDYFQSFDFKTVYDIYTDSKSLDELASRLNNKYRIKALHIKWVEIFLYKKPPWLTTKTVIFFFILETYLKIMFNNLILLINIWQLY